MNYLGIDPGVNGGIAILQDQDVIYLSLTDKTYLDMFNWLKQSSTRGNCLIEKVHAMPKQGVKSMFTFGQIYGAMQMLVVSQKISYQLVTPREWQKELGITKRGKNESKYQFKTRLRGTAQNLFPGLDLWDEKLGIQNSVCDALLIAEYCRRVGV